MGVFIDYVLSAECEEEELVSRLERVRRRCLDLPLKSVGKVRRLAPVYNPVNLTLFESEGHTLPPKIKRRFEAAEKRFELGQRCISFALLLPTELPEKLQRRYLAPAFELIDRTDLWKKEDLPEKIGMSDPLGLTSYSINRAVIELEFANILLRYGYMLLLDPGEGSETVNLGLAAYKRMKGSSISEPPVWYGRSFTRTQYARDFIRVHETVCRVLDIVNEEGLLFSGGDTCGYYADRTWKEAGQRVNDEMIFAKAMSNIIDVGIGNLREAGVNVKVLVDNASKAGPVDFASRLKPDVPQTDDGDDAHD
jgi:hypothetical protein